MKKEILLVIVICLGLSCKTIRVSEKGVLKPSKYDFELYNKYLKESNQSSEEKLYMTNVLTALIKTDKAEIYNNGKLIIYRKFFQANDSIKLEYFEFEPKNFTKTGMFYLGNASSVTSNFTELEKISVETKSKLFVLNYRGYGKSDGTPSFETLFADNQSFLKYIELKNPTINFAIGHSFGTISATYLAVENNIENLILLSPLSNTKDFLAKSKKNYTKGLKSLLRPFVKLKTDDKLMSISNSEKIKAYQGRLIVFHTKDDEWLPIKMGKTIFKNCSSPNKEFIVKDKGGHFAAFESSNWNEIIERLK